MRTYLIAANWKMNSAPMGAFNPDSLYATTPLVDTIVLPNFLDIYACKAAGLTTGGQHARAEDAGAFTGEVSIAQLAKAGCSHVLCGHSERRQYHQETNEQVAAQVAAALAHNVVPIVCIGETLTEREQGSTEQVLQAQLAKLPTHTSIIYAYEPVWAIGTGKTPTPPEADAAHLFIRNQLPTELQATTRILYGGSMKVTNAQVLLEQLNIDGGLLGGASLIPEEFKAIVKIAEQVSRF